jgi:Fe-S cluster assembly ATPase SufC
VKASIRLSCDPPRTPRVLQVGSLFNVPLDGKLSLAIDADLPVEDREWNIGLIVGPSGAGKSSLAAELWPDALLGTQEWGTDAGLVDCFPGGMSIKEITGLLSAVGLSTIPSWVRPFRTLSTGEQFRASIARAMAETSGLVVVDEYSSTVDRQVARVASHALQKTVRRAARQLIAVSCHFDLAEWLQPDWTYDVATGEFTWGSVQRTTADPHRDPRRRPLSVATI